MCIEYYDRTALPQTNIAPEIQWLEDELSFWGPAYIQVRKCWFQGV